MKKLLNLIGKHGELNIAGLKISVEITDIRKVFGRIDYQVTPISGSSQIWVQSQSVKLEGE